MEIGLKRDVPSLVKIKNRCNRITTTLNARSFQDQLNDVQIASERAMIKRLFDTNKVDAKPEDLKEIPASRRKNFGIGEWHLLRVELEERVTQRKAARKKAEIEKRQRETLLESQVSTKQEVSTSEKNEVKPNEQSASK